MLLYLYCFRTDGITQNELCKEMGIANNCIYYILKTLETRGLIVRQSTIIRKKTAGNEEYKNGSIVNTNMLHLYRYSKHLGQFQRLEITKEDNAEGEDASGEGVFEERVNDFVPAFRDICDRLEKADGKVTFVISADSVLLCLHTYSGANCFYYILKVLVVSDIKKDLGYRDKRGHRSWRNVASVV